MSDTSQGPDWWQASDGKWYPPSAASGQPLQLANRFCMNCAAPTSPGAAACLSCGFQPDKGGNFCGGCGSPITEGQVVCVKCGQAVRPKRSGGSAQLGDKSKVAAGLLAILLGWLGIHKFYLGRTTPGMIMLGVTVASYCGGFVIGVLTFGLGIILFFAAPIVWIIGIIEGIIYLTKTDEDFYEEYVVEGKDWF